VTQLPLPIAASDAAALLGGTGVHATSIPRTARIHVNRNLRLDAIHAVGFDLDYTLAIYRQDEMDRLQTEVTIDKMVRTKGYPESLRGAPVRHDFAIRGLFVDKKLGHVLKMDRYRYVKRAYHGHTPLSRDERRRLYHARPVHAGTKRYHWVDTLYTLPEVSLYAAAVEHLEALGGEVDFAKLFEDIRECIDVAHQDGSVTGVIQNDPERFVVRDPMLPHALERLRGAGKKLFLLTNSQPAYTEAIASHLLDAALPQHPRWRSYFDAVVCAAKKPRFFTETDVPVITAENGGTVLEGPLEPGKLYQGGCLPELERLLDVRGDEVLYVGDHIYGDVLRAKKESAWRTMMVIQEMATELDAHERVRASLARLDELFEVSELLVDELKLHQAQLRAVEDELAKAGPRPSTSLQTARVTHKKSLERVKTRLSMLDEERDRLEDESEAVFHAYWGSLFKTGPEVSSFGDQVEQYACLYTDRASNLLHYSNAHYFRGPRDRMPHEL
jgi:HAD superfamily 5'-nucleotidase-like hydrolase